MNLCQINSKLINSNQNFIKLVLNVKIPDFSIFEKLNGKKIIFIFYR